MHTDARGNDWTYQTDYYGLTIAMANAAPFEDLWKYERNGHGLVTKRTEPAGGGGTAALGELETQYSFDAKGNLNTVTYADGSGQSWHYDPRKRRKGTVGFFGQGRRLFELAAVDNVAEMAVDIVEQRGVQFLLQPQDEFVCKIQRSSSDCSNLVLFTRGSN